MTADIVADASLLKPGTRLAVAGVRLYSEGVPEPVAQATITCSIPPQAQAGVPLSANPVD